VTDENPENSTFTALVSVGGSTAYSSRNPSD
jgi:hypothetical protein